MLIPIKYLSMPRNVINNKLFVRISKVSIDNTHNHKMYTYANVKFTKYNSITQHNYTVNEYKLYCTSIITFVDIFHVFFYIYC